MSERLPTRRMREHPDLIQLKRQAKELLRGFQDGDARADAEVQAYYDRADRVTFALHDAQLVIARSYGFDSWPKLKAYVDGVTIRRLVEAVRSGDSGRVRAMLDSRPELADMQVSYANEHRGIHYAVMERSLEMVQVLMRHGANARAGIHPHRAATSAWTLARDRGHDEIVAAIEEEERLRGKHEEDTGDEPEPVFGDELAREAVARGDLEWMRARYAEGQLVNRVRWDGGGLMTVAVRNDRMDALRLMLDWGFDPDERVASGKGDWTAYSQGYALWYAAALGRRAMAELLLDRGADPNVHVDSSGSAVYSAYSHKQWEMAELLRSRGGLVTGDIAGIYRLTEIARKMLTDDGARAEELVRFGASGGATEIVRMALPLVGWARGDERWFGILSQPLSFWHHIPWLYAGNKEFDRESYLECFRSILGACDVNVMGPFGRSILHEIAAMRDWITEDEVAAFGRLVLQAGARLDARDDILRSTPLGWACRWGWRELVRLLIEHGADRVEADSEPWARPRAWALKMEHDEIAAMLS